MLANLSPVFTSLIIAGFIVALGVLWAAIVYPVGQHQNLLDRRRKLLDLITNTLSRLSWTPVYIPQYQVDRPPSTYRTEDYEYDQIKLIVMTVICNLRGQTKWDLAEFTGKDLRAIDRLIYALQSDHLVEVSLDFSGTPQHQEVACDYDLIIEPTKRGFAWLVDHLPQANDRIQQPTPPAS
ncbi:hypothetical protein HJC99_01415 [Candidatus Saccharibacteria bacterium]|nr:hypothetical protein [Candidatus Saccharibacteria bacterium]